MGWGGGSFELGLTWPRVHSRGSYMDALGLTWTHMDSLAGSHWDSLGLTWIHLQDLTWTRLDSLGLT